MSGDPGTTSKRGSNGTFAVRGALLRCSLTGGVAAALGRAALVLRRAAGAALATALVVRARFPAFGAGLVAVRSVILPRALDEVAFGKAFFAVLLTAAFLVGLRTAVFFAVLVTLAVGFLVPAFMTSVFRSPTKAVPWHYHAHIAPERTRTGNNIITLVRKRMPGIVLPTTTTRSVRQALAEQ